MSHSLVFQEETATDVVFRCVHCNRIIGFNKPGVGEPAAELVDGQWAHPPNPDQWMELCDE